MIGILIFVPGVRSALVPTTLTTVPELSIDHGSDGKYSPRPSDEIRSDRRNLPAEVKYETREVRLSNAQSVSRTKPIRCRS